MRLSVGGIAAAAWTVEIPLRVDASLSGRAVPGGAACPAEIHIIIVYPLHWHCRLVWGCASALYPPSGDVQVGTHSPGEFFTGAVGISAEGSYTVLGVAVCPAKAHIIIVCPVHRRCGPVGVAPWFCAVVHRCGAG